MNTGQAFLVGVLTSLIANFLFFFALRASDRPSAVLRVRNGSFRVGEARTGDRAIRHEQTSSEILIEGASIELSWGSRTKFHIGMSVIGGLIVFGILFWVLVMK